MLANVLIGESPIGRTRPVAAVAIPGGGKGDRPVGSPGVKVLVGWARVRSDLPGGQASRQVVAKVKQQASKSVPHLKQMVGLSGTPSRLRGGEGQRRRRRNWACAADGFPGVSEHDMPTQNGWRKHGTTRRSPRRTCTAKASRISRRAVKSRCAYEWGGWGRVSVDGPGQKNPDRSEGPWGRATAVARTAVRHRAQLPDADRIDAGRATGRTKGGGKPRDGKGMPGAGLTESSRGKALPERPALKPYWGKPAVRNFRGDDGDVGIIRSPVRAIVLPDSWCPGCVFKTQPAGLHRSSP
jgi:hypothetical protein